MEQLWNEIFNDEFLIMASRLSVALLLSGLIGFERELNNHSAGFRTHILVGIGSCLMMLLSLYGFENYIEMYENTRFDPARIPSYVISGIGFLGAGTIIVNGMTIRGLTTAASIWAVAGLGLVVGAGMYAEAVLTTIIILVSLALLNNFEKIFHRGRKQLHIEITIEPTLNIQEVEAIITKLDYSILKIRLNKEMNSDRVVLLELKNKKDKPIFELFDTLAKLPNVKQVREWQ